ncbi:hypothetical protein N624_2059 [Levilactobacillus brevis]|nr:hypothetical protein N624_2059 [Levilactobacillus brevis]
MGLFDIFRRRAKEHQLAKRKKHQLSRPQQRPLPLVKRANRQLITLRQLLVKHLPQQKPARVLNQQ